MKKAIVIGATSGIGRGVAKLLAENGYQVGIAGRRTELLEGLQQAYPNQMTAKTIDITETYSAITHLEKLMYDLGGMDLFIMSSGTGNINEELDYTKEKDTIFTNVVGFTCLVDWAFKHFEQNRTGHLVGITSIGGLRGGRQSPAYNASKAYQINYLEGLRQKVKKLKLPITVTDIRPGFVDTAMAKGEGQFWVASVEKVAKQIYKAIQSKKKVAYVTRRWFLVASLLIRIPRPVYERM